MWQLIKANSKSTNKSHLKCKPKKVLVLLSCHAERQKKLCNNSLFKSCWTKLRDKLHDIKKCENEYLSLYIKFRLYSPKIHPTTFLPEIFLNDKKIFFSSFLSQGHILAKSPTNVTFAIRLLENLAVWKFTWGMCWKLFHLFFDFF